MSDGGEGKRQVLLEPQTTIGAKDLLAVGDVAYHGFLRKCGTLERYVQRAGFLKLIFREVAKWRQKFVVISKGCLYIYIDETSTSPFQSLSLRGYDRVVRTQDGISSTRHSFKLYSMGQQQRKAYIFGSATENDRKMWMKKIKDEIKLANEAQEEDPSDFVDQEDEYITLERQVNVKEYPPTAPKKPGRRPPPPPPKDDDDGDLDDYDKIDEFRRDLPDVPVNTRADNSNDNTGQGYYNQKEEKKKKEKPKVADKPKLVKQLTLSRESYEFKGSDRDQVQSILQQRPDGTFLVRQSRSSTQEVLSVQTEDGVKEYKIFQKDQKFTINHTQYFQTIEEMLQFYKKNALPHRSLSLSRGYSEQDLRVM